MIDLHTYSFKEEYPILKNKNYLASHSLGAVPFSAKEALFKYYQAWESEGILAWEGDWGKQITIFCSQIERILGASENTVVPMENVTRGFQAIASCWNWAKTTKNEIILTDLEFSTAYPFWKGLEKLGANVKIISSEDGISVSSEKIIREISQNTALIVTSHVYFRSGAIQNLALIAHEAHKFGAYVLGDGYQAAGTIPVNVRDLDVDFYVGGSHKWLCGGAGAAYLYVSPKISLQPIVSGWFGLSDPFRYEPTTELKLSTGVNRFMMGTPALPALFAAEKGIEKILNLGIKNIRNYSIELTECIINEAEKRNWAIKSPIKSSDRSGMVCVSFSGDEELTHSLTKENTIVDWRPNCGIRISPHFYNSIDNVLSFFEVADFLINKHK